MLKGLIINKDNNKNWEIGYSYNEGEEAFFINEKLGYRLSIADKALRSGFYLLLQTKYGGENWKTINEDPYLKDRVFLLVSFFLMNSLDLLLYLI